MGKEIMLKDFKERIKRRNKKPKFICELLTDDNKITINEQIWKIAQQTYDTLAKTSLKVIFLAPHS